jgi:pimeloyl-ACP methyl ester carboxylesterase
MKKTKLKKGVKDLEADIVHEQGYFRSEDGLKLYFSCEGPRGAPILLFCYGIVCSAHQWKYQMAHFKKKYRVLYMDYRGHNQSETPRDLSTMTLDMIARDLGLLLDELKIGPVPVLGHSLGVSIALAMAHLHPEKVSALILASGTPRDPFETMFHHNFLQPGFELIRKIYGIAPALVDAFWKSQGVNPLNQEFISRVGFNKKYVKRSDVNEYLRITSSIELGVFIHLLTDFTRFNACPWLGDLRVPTLVIGGAKDMITPIDNQRIIAKLVSGAKFVKIQEGSHNAQMEFPNEVNQNIEKFLSRMQMKQAPAV